MAPCDAHELIAKLRAENERLQRAVEWCLENGAYRNCGSNGPYISDIVGNSGEVPAEFVPILKPAREGVRE